MMIIVYQSVEIYVFDDQERYSHDYDGVVKYGGKDLGETIAVSMKDVDCCIEEYGLIPVCDPELFPECEADF